ncbi:RICIN domain-containing protein [Streptomyces sp. NBC_00322]|uniref:RICIN domain-containing protein n=1 Tax=Streptomyces sp. NBC_00322 TaxID=2975712 RepID=UPI002E29FCCA|nr:RICIN domain-containing protein [Streptomyces sp. NBC_00322]
MARRRARHILVVPRRRARHILLAILTLCLATLGIAVSPITFSKAHAGTEECSGPSSYLGRCIVLESDVNSEGGSRVLDVKWAARTELYNGGNTQRWFFVMSDADNHGTFTIRNANSGNCLDEISQTIHEEICDGRSRQDWYIQPLENSSHPGRFAWQIRHAGDDLCLGVRDYDSSLIDLSVCKAPRAPNARNQAWLTPSDFAEGATLLEATATAYALQQHNRRDTYIKIGTEVSSSPALAGAIRDDDCCALMFARGPNGHLMSNEGGTSWKDLGGPPTLTKPGTFIGAPAAVGSGPTWALPSPTRWDVVVRGTDNHAWHLSYAKGKMGKWENLGAWLIDSPAISSWGSNQLTVFGRLSDNKLYSRMWDGARWGTWKNLGGPPTSTKPGTFIGAPAAVSWAPGRIDVVVRGTDNHAWHLSYAKGEWGSKWENLYGYLVDSPAISSKKENQLTIFGRNSDNKLYRKAWNGAGWGTWYKLEGPRTSTKPGTFIGAPTAVSIGGVEYVAVRGTDNHAWFRENWTKH